MADPKSVRGYGLVEQLTGRRQLWVVEPAQIGMQHLESPI